MTCANYLIFLFSLFSGNCICSSCSSCYDGLQCILKCSVVSHPPPPPCLMSVCFIVLGLSGIKCVSFTPDIDLFSTLSGPGNWVFRESTTLYEHLACSAFLLRRYETTLCAYRQGLCTLCFKIHSQSPTVYYLREGKKNT